MKSKVITFLGALALIGGIASAPLALAQTNAGPAPGSQPRQTSPHGDMMNGQGMKGAQGSMGNMGNMMSMMGEMSRMMNNCNSMMESMNSSRPSGGSSQGAQHSPG